MGKLFYLQSNRHNKETLEVLKSIKNVLIIVTINYEQYQFFKKNLKKKKLKLFI